MVCKVCEQQADAKPIETVADAEANLNETGRQIHRGRIPSAAEIYKPRPNGSSDDEGDYERQQALSERGRSYLKEGWRDVSTKTPLTALQQQNMIDEMTLAQTYGTKNIPREEDTAYLAPLDKFRYLLGEDAAAVMHWFLTANTSFVQDVLGLHRQQIHRLRSEIRDMNSPEVERVKRTLDYSADRRRERKLGQKIRDAVIKAKLRAGV